MVSRRVAHDEIRSGGLGPFVLYGRSDCSFSAIAEQLLLEHRIAYERRDLTAAPQLAGRQSPVLVDGGGRSLGFVDLVHLLSPGRTSRAAA